MIDAAETAENNEPITNDAPQELLPSSPRRFWQAIVVSLVIGAALLLFAYIDTRQGVNNTAPDFTLTAYDGSTYRLSDLHGKVVVINFWASWCVPCRAEAPTLEAVWSHLKDGPVIFLGVDQQDSLEKAQAFLKETGVSYPTGPDNGIVAAYGIQGLPTTIVVDQRGDIANRTLASIDGNTLQALVQKLLSSPDSTQGSTQDQPG